MGKNPLIAAFLSLLLPGLGQIYNREYKNSLNFFLPALLFSLFFKFSLFFLLLSWLITLLSAYDAYITAKESIKRKKF